jgi:hypothetical protein
MFYPVLPERKRDSPVIKFLNGGTRETLVADRYDYDANGNMTKDLNGNITNVSYNFLNLLRDDDKC